MTKNWLKMAEMYRRFSGDSGFDFSDGMAEEAFRYESTGLGQPSKMNGFVHGKQVMDITVKMWKEDILGLILHVRELKEDFPDWFLRKVLPKGWLV